MSSVPRTVLIVDDHPGFRATARLMLEADGYQVLGEAADAAQAVAQAARLRPQVVLLDVNLPDADGFSVARALSSGDAAPIVILVSSRDRSDYGPLIDECGARGFIPKAELTGDALGTVLV